MIMATLCRTFTVCVLFTALFAWSKVTALSEASIIIIIPSNGASISSSMLSTHLSMTATARPNSTIMPSPNMTTVPSPNKTVTPSPNMTTVPSPNKTVTPSPNMTTVPSPNRTVTPSPNMTTVPSPNKTVTPSPNMTTTYSHNMTIMPHNATVMPSMPSHSMTIVPSSAHSVMPTSSAHPTPPSPTWGNFSVKNKNNTACLIANMGATFNVMIRSKESTIELPVNASPSGACAGPSSEQPYITLQWHTPEGSYNFTMHFVTYAKKKEDFNAASSQRWAAANLTFSLETQDGGTKTFHSAPEILTELSADLGSSYQCLTSATDFKLMAVNSSVNVSLIHIEFQPFEVQDGHLGKAEVCATPVSTTHSPSGKTTAKPPKKSGSHVVAIAVGCSLAGLVVIVIVGYVIGRRRSRNASAGYRQL